MTTYQQIQQAEQQLNDLLNHLNSISPHSEALGRAQACLTEGFEHMVYAARGQIANEGTHLECLECGRQFPLHHGVNGCPDGHTQGATVVIDKHP